jgi:hypothetical protein
VRQAGTAASLLILEEDYAAGLRLWPDPEPTLLGGKSGALAALSTPVKF